MRIPYRRLAALALLVFAAGQIFVLIELTHDADREGQVFVSMFFAIALAIALLLHQVDAWWPSALAAVGGVLSVLTSLPYASHFVNFDKAWEFAPISLTLAGAICAIAFAATDLVQRRRRASADAPVFLAPAFGAAVSVIATLIAASFAVTLSNVDSVSAEDREGATVVRMKEIKFAPKELTASVGEPVRLVVENGDLGSHTFVLTAPGADIDEYFGAGDERVVEFAIAEPGTYTFRCDIEGHTKMKGTITVQ